LVFRLTIIFCFPLLLLLLSLRILVDGQKKSGDLGLIWKPVEKLFEVFVFNRFGHFIGTKMFAKDSKESEDGSGYQHERMEEPPFWSSLSNSKGSRMEIRD
jgi:hypothetical protein